jgi:hypothetical protein
MRVTPRDLLALGAADAVVEPSDVGSWLAQVASAPAEERLRRRRVRWSQPLPGRL